LLEIRMRKKGKGAGRREKKQALDKASGSALLSVLLPFSALSALKT